MFHVMHQRLPCPSFKTLTDWWNSEVPCLRWRVVDFYTKKVLGTLKLLDQLDIIGTFIAKFLITNENGFFLFLFILLIAELLIVLLLEGKLILKNLI